MLGYTSLVALSSSSYSNAISAQPKLNMVTGSTSIYDVSTSGNIFPIDKLDLSKCSQGWGSPEADLSVDKTPLTINGVVYKSGFGTHAQSVLQINLNRSAVKFTSMVGIDDATKGQGAVIFEVVVDGKIAAKSPVMHGGDAAVPISVDLTNAKRMILIVRPAGDGINFDHADWADAQFELAPGATTTPQSATTPLEPARMIIPVTPAKPEIHGATITGATPHYRFRFLVPVSGKRPMTYFAKGLPPGLKLNMHTGIITGALPHDGKWNVKLIAKNALGTASEMFTIVGGSHKLALTPPMGWNSWNCWAGAVDQSKVADAAKEMVQTGLADYGYTYINIDDTWEAPRAPDGEIMANQKFPSMRALANKVHSYGLKLGIYSSPGPTTCAGYPASYLHELQDAQTYSKWGIDYLKYDWCSYTSVAKGTGLEYYWLPYAVMRGALNQVHRDILFSFCQYGMDDVWKWGAATGGNCWRDTGDIRDSWSSLSSIINAQIGLQKYNGPGHWNDPDMLVVGRVGWGDPHPTHLTPNEQLMHISMWSMFSAPLLIGCDMTKLDPFTLAILTNPEVLAINQDPLGKTAYLVSKTNNTEIWERPLADGTHAVALLNMGYSDKTISVSWKQLHLSGDLAVRDLWLHKNEGMHKRGISFKVPIHGVVLVKIGHFNANKA